MSVRHDIVTDQAGSPPERLLSENPTVGRRGFLCQLASLPLIGGGVTLIGQPTASAEPVTPDLLEAYKTWLDMEMRFLCWDMAGDPIFIDRYKHHHGTEEQVGRSKVIGGHLAFVGDSGNFHGGRKSDVAVHPRGARALGSRL